MEFLTKLLIVIGLAFIYTLIFRFIAVRLGFQDKSYDNPLSIAITVSLLVLVMSYIPIMQGLVFMIINLLIPAAMAKEFYDVSWAASFKFAFLFVLILALLSLISAVAIAIL